MRAGKEGGCAVVAPPAFGPSRYADNTYPLNEWGAEREGGRGGRREGGMLGTPKHQVVLGRPREPDKGDGESENAGSEAQTRRKGNLFWRARQGPG